MHKAFPVLHVLSMVIVLFAATMLLPLGLALGEHDAARVALSHAMLITLAAGFLLWLLTRGASKDLKVRDGFLLVVVVWTVLPALGGLPLMLYLPGLSFTDAYFEAMSGLTTTGSTVLVGLDRLPQSLNLWRGEMVWLGGMGIIVLVVAILPLLGIGGRQIYKAETPGPMKDSQLTPRITETAKGLWLVYAGITIACITSYWWAGMTLFDAVMHAFSTMGLGGFSSHDASFGYFNSPRIEAVGVIFMLIAGINFATHFMAVRSRGVNPYKHDVEARYFIGVTLLSVVMLTLYLWGKHVYPDLPTAFRYALFNVVSIATTTGFASTDYNIWPMFAPMWMLFLCSFATSSGSTGGGIKMIRALILYKQVYKEFLRIIHPNAIVQAKLDGVVVQNKIIYAVLAFFFIYIVSIVSMTLIMMASGLEPLTAFSAVIASINNTGPGLNEVGPATTFAGLSDLQTWVCTFAMLLGRLELFTLLVVLTPAFWRK